MKLAQEQGLFLEVVMIAESIISNRLVSRLAKVEKHTSENQGHTFGGLIKAWRS